MKKLYAVIDTNVLVSALLTNVNLWIRQLLLRLLVLVLMLLLKISIILDFFLNLYVPAILGSIPKDYVEQ